MLSYVEVLAVTPAKATRDHVVGLREAGFRDEEIFEIVMVTAYYALRCRMADGLGVDVDDRARTTAVLVDAFSYRRRPGS
jgi:alkylhydroperoxidase family enzyme